MAETWYTLYETANGKCRAHTSVLPSPVDPSFTVINHGANRMDQTMRWNAATKAWDIPIPVPVLVDRLQDLVAHPYVADVWSNMTAARRTKLRKLMVWLLATHRYRLQNDRVSLDADDAWPVDPSLVSE